MGPLEQYQSLLDSNKFVFLVYFRGHWCPFCTSYLHKLQELSTAIQSQSGVVAAVTAEPESELPKTRSASGFEGPIIVDPSHLLAAEFRKKGLIDIAVSAKRGYPEGMAQPAILVLKGHNQDDVLYSWAVIPSLMNFGGAKDRPLLDQVWDNVESQLQGHSMPHKNVKKTTAFGLLREKILA